LDSVPGALDVLAEAAERIATDEDNSRCEKNHQSLNHVAPPYCVSDTITTCSNGYASANNGVRSK
jgi:hypothetical protein